jgi:heme-based aerotactic transducer
MNHFFTYKTNKNKPGILASVENYRNSVEINIKNGTTIHKQLKLIDLTLEDLMIIRTLQPFVKEQLDLIVEQFYSNLSKDPSLMNIINDNSSIDRLKTTLTKHIYEMFSGQLNDAFINQHMMLELEVLF